MPAGTGARRRGGSKARGPSGCGRSCPRRLTSPRPSICRPKQNIAEVKKELKEYGGDYNYDRDDGSNYVDDNKSSSISSSSGGGGGSGGKTSIVKRHNI